MVRSCMRIVVLDLDETLGHFVEFGIFWDCLQVYFNNLLTINEFIQILDLYPEFIRPNIMAILNYLKYKKQKNICNKVIIYTNNQGPLTWAEKIIQYFEYKIKNKLFDQIIGAYKINNKQIELCRTTHYKTVNDLQACTKIPKSAKICFVDDQYHPYMNNHNVTYINIKPYVYTLSYNKMITRFLNSNLGLLLINNKSHFHTYMMRNLNQYNFTILPKTKLDLEHDKILSQRLMYHMQDFLSPPNNQKIYKKKCTISKKNSRKNNTRKKHK